MSDATAAGSASCFLATYIAQLQVGRKARLTLVPAMEPPPIEDTLHMPAGIHNEALARLDLRRLGPTPDFWEVRPMGRRQLL
jgi:hypothetical protein